MCCKFSFSFSRIWDERREVKLARLYDVGAGNFRKIAGMWQDYTGACSLYRGVLLKAAAVPSLALPLRASHTLYYLLFPFPLCIHCSLKYRTLYPIKFYLLGIHILSSTPSQFKSLEKKNLWVKININVKRKISFLTVISYFV